MNKNAAIIEGDTTKKFIPVSKVKVSNSDTGESTWIPEDSKETHSLSVIKNGIYYAASEGLTAYDIVTVNVSSETEVNYEGIIADMPDLADLGLYDLDDLEGLEGLDLDLDELQDLENLILDGDLEEGEIPTSGSTIKGIDPDSGETLEVGLDEDGNLMEQALPDHIHIVVYPRKRHYQEGEIIDLSGIHVYLMKKGTERFTCEQYPTGEIPFEELMHEPISAEASDTEKNWSTDADVTVDGSVVTHGLYCEERTNDENDFWSHLWTDTYGAVGEVSREVYGSGGFYLHAGNPPFRVLCYLTQDGIPAYIMASNHAMGGIGEHYANVSVSASWGQTDGSTYTHNNKTVYYSTTGIFSDVFDSRQTLISPSNIVSGANAGAIAWAMIYGDLREGVDCEITVSWMRSDGEILEDTFPITIGDGEDPEPEPDPYAGAYDFIWEGKAYCFNKSLARSEVMYSNGTVWQTWLGGQSPPYTVDQALKLKLIVQVGWSGGGSTSGGF